MSYYYDQLKRRAILRPHITLFVTPMIKSIFPLTVHMSVRQQM